jgi:hypothetical protein
MWETSTTARYEETGERTPQQREFKNTHAHKKSVPPNLASPAQHSFLCFLRGLLNVSSSPPSLTLPSPRPLSSPCRSDPQGHPMKPHRVRMTHNLLLHYGIYKEMEVSGRATIHPVP